MTRNKCRDLLSISTLLFGLSFTSCEGSQKTSESKIQKSALPVKKPGKSVKTKKSKPQPKVSKKMVEIPGKSSEWANKDVFEIIKEMETFPPQRELSWEEGNVYHDKWNEYLEKFIEKYKQYKGGEISKEAFLEFLGPEPNTLNFVNYSV